MSCRIHDAVGFAISWFDVSSLSCICKVDKRFNHDHSLVAELSREAELSLLEQLMHETHDEETAEDAHRALAVELFSEYGVYETESDTDDGRGSWSS